MKIYRYSSERHSFLTLKFSQYKNFSEVPVRQNFRTNFDTINTSPVTKICVTVRNYTSFQNMIY